MRTLIKNLNDNLNKEVVIEGWIHQVRKLKSITFIIVRDRTGLVQCVMENKKIKNALRLESVVKVIGTVKEGKNKLNSFEIKVEAFEVTSAAKKELPIEINKENLDINLDTMLNNRFLSLRHRKSFAIFKIQNLIVQGFRGFLRGQDFTEIFTPKIVKEGVEGGCNSFEVKYFEETAYLAQSPQFYKQMMVGAGFERVFEVAHVYRAEEHNTNRHLNEYVSMDLEMGFIEDEKDIMKLEEKLLSFIMKKVKLEGEEYLNLLQAKVPSIKDSIPKIEFKEAIKILNTEYGKNDVEDDLDPEGEKLICKWAKEKYDSDFLFLTDYPRKKRPMYTMPKGEKYTHSFDLLFRGIEITTGGQRIHDYNMLLDNITYKGLDISNYKGYTDMFKYGMPKHGGLAIGLERISSRLLGIENVRECTLITRDRTRLIP